MSMWYNLHQHFLLCKLQLEEAPYSLQVLNYLYSCFLQNSYKLLGAIMKRHPLLYFLSLHPQL